MSKEAEKAGNHERNKYESLLTPAAYITVLRDYYRRVIRNGDWYSLQKASRIIKAKNYNSQKEKRLPGALSFISQCRSLAKAKASCPPCKLDAFKQTLDDLDRININPVTIPREWGYSHIPNLLRSYLHRTGEEHLYFDSPFTGEEEISCRALFHKGISKKIQGAS